MVEAVPILTKVVVILVIPKAAPVEEVEEAEAVVVVVVVGTDANRAILKIPAGVIILAEVLHQQTRVGMIMEAKAGIQVVVVVAVAAMDLVSEAAVVVVEAAGTNAVSTVI